ncbi:MAG: GGDEF domain-containing protein [Myxococcales bacterium]|nr:MAG: GGDEF domain-containing protein [Myxococcales bacterium]
MNDKLEKVLYLLMGFYALLFVLANFDFATLQLDLSNWVQFLLVILFFVLILQFWKVAKRLHAEEVTRASITDSLSLLFNSRHFFRTLEGEIDRSRRKAHPLSALYLDIDYFHRYNETHGLKAGDRVLRFIGDLIRNSTRKYDAGFRFGNDEFALILPETDRMQGRIIAERLRESFFNQFGGELALSIGVASLEDNDNVDRMVRKAEAAMEDARRGGGNRIRAYIDRGQI